MFASGPLRASASEPPRGGRDAEPEPKPDPGALIALAVVVDGVEVVPDETSLEHRPARQGEHAEDARVHGGDPIVGDDARAGACISSLGASRRRSTRTSVEARFPAERAAERGGLGAKPPSEMPSPLNWNAFGGVTGAPTSAPRASAGAKTSGTNEASEASRDGIIRPPRRFRAYSPADAGAPRAGVRPRGAPGIGAGPHSAIRPAGGGTVPRWRPRRLVGSRMHC